MDWVGRWRMGGCGSRHRRTTDIDEGEGRRGSLIFSDFLPGRVLFVARNRADEREIGDRSCLGAVGGQDRQVEVPGAVSMLSSNSAQTGSETDPVWALLEDKIDR